MLKSTTASLCCPKCQNLELHLDSEKERMLSDGITVDVSHGALLCKKCRSTFPILQGVAFLLRDVTTYLQNHCKGISQKVALDEIPLEFRDDYELALREYQDEARQYPQDFEEDLESARVNALYLMNHYLRAADWNSSGLFAHDLIAAHWDQGPIDIVAQWIASAQPKPVSIVELGSGVGGLAGRVTGSQPQATYLGVDSSFLSTWYARQWNVLQATDQAVELRIPDDLLAGTQSRLLHFRPLRAKLGHCDFILADMEGLPLRAGNYDALVALNAIDMLENPAELARQCGALLRSGGLAVQSAPYIWAERVAKKLRKAHTGSRDLHSAGLVRKLWEDAGFEIERDQDGIPWIFYKHARQIELYWVHALAARKA